MSMPKGVGSTSVGKKADRPQGATEPVQRLHHGRVVRLQAAQGSAGESQGIPQADRDLLLRALLARLTACVTAPLPSANALQLLQKDQPALRSTVLECVHDLESLRASLLKPAAAFGSVLDACGCDPGVG